jgi:hypothetical protein
MATTGRRIDDPPENTMEYHIALHATPVDLGAVDEVVRAIDPAALVDLDHDTLRVSTYLRASELTTLIAAAGYPLDDGQLTQLPSTCCGGCSG